MQHVTIFCQFIIKHLLLLTVLRFTSISYMFYIQQACFTCFFLVVVAWAGHAVVALLLFAKRVLCVFRVQSTFFIRRAFLFVTKGTTVALSAHMHIHTVPLV